MSIRFAWGEVRALAIMKCSGVCRVENGWEREADSEIPLNILIPDAVMAPLVIRGLVEVLEDDLGVFAQLTKAGDELMGNTWQ